MILQLVPLQVPWTSSPADSFPVKVVAQIDPQHSLTWQLCSQDRRESMNHEDSREDVDSKFQCDDQPQYQSANLGHAIHVWQA